MTNAQSKYTLDKCTFDVAVAEDTMTFVDAAILWVLERIKMLNKCI